MHVSMCTTSLSEEHDKYNTDLVEQCRRRCYKVESVWMLQQRMTCSRQWRKTDDRHTAGRHWYDQQLNTSSHSPPDYSSSSSSITFRKNVFTYARHQSLNLAICLSSSLYAKYITNVPSVLWRCWLGGRKGIWPVKNWVVGCWHGYLSGARCRLAYSPADVSCFSKIQVGFTFLVPAHPGSPGKRAIKPVYY